METKQLISIRLRTDLLKKVDALCQTHNKESKHVWYDGSYYYQDDYKSRADVIEDALKKYFAPGVK